MPRYEKEYLYQFFHKTYKNPQHQPYPSPERTYGADAQKNETARYITSTTNRSNKTNRTHNSKFLY